MTFSSVFPNDDDDDLGERKANATFAEPDDDEDDDSSNTNRLLARSFSHAFSSSSFSLVRSNASSSIGFVNTIIILGVSSVNGVFCVFGFLFLSKSNCLLF